MTDEARLTKTELIRRIHSLKKRSGQAKAVAALSAASKLRDSEERLRALVHTAVEGIITIDERGAIESVNPAAEKMFGYGPGELIGRKVNVLMPAPHALDHDSYLSNYIHTGHAKIIGIGREVMGKRKNGSLFPMDLSVGEVRLAKRRMFTGIIRDISVRKKLEQEILSITERERRRIGEDLHDGLCQHLAGIELMSQALERSLAKRSRKEAAPAAKITQHIRDAITQTRSLARGLSPVQLDSAGLMSALHELAANISDLFRIKCSFRNDRPVLIRDNAVATHLFRIAQEAVSNALKHGKARKVEIVLAALPQHILLVVHDDGRGFPNRLNPAKGTAKGMGLRIMSYRAGMIGGSLAIQREKNGGTTVACTVHQSAAAESTK